MLSDLDEDLIINSALGDYCQRVLPDLVPDTIRPLPKQGYLNRTYSAEHRIHGELVCRATTNPYRDGHDYLSKEIWIYDKLAQVGVACPRVVSEVHTFALPEPDSLSFYLMQYIPGVGGEVLGTDESKRFQCYRALGEILKKTQAIACKGQGRVFDSSQGEFTDGWRAYLSRDCNRWRSSERVRLILPDDFAVQSESLLEAAVSLTLSESLCHGDPHLDNLLFDEQRGSVNAIIDWERAYSGIKPICDIADVWYHQVILRAAFDESVLYSYLHKDVLPLEIEGLLTGLGISASEYFKRFRRDVDLLFLIRSLPFVQWYEAASDDKQIAQWQHTITGSIPYLVELMEKLTRAC
jgi:aminoglycoside phosphotransferase (APT) family kinase protein